MDLGTLSRPLPGQGAPPGAGAAPTPGAPAPATPSSAPDGNIVQAHARVQIALSMLNSTLSQFQPGSEEHKIVMETVKRLQKQFSGMTASKTLAPSEAAQMNADAQASGEASLQQQG